MPTVLAILPEGFEELEAVGPIDLLRRANIEVTVAALGETIHVTGRNALTMHADTTLTAVGERLFDLLFLPGGPGVRWHVSGRARSPFVYCVASTNRTGSSSLV